MRMQSNISASDTSPELPWKKLKGIAGHLMRQTGIAETHSLPSSQVFSLAKRRMHKMGGQCIGSHIDCSVQERLQRILALPGEDTVTISVLTTLWYAPCTQFRSQTSGSLQGETQLCQR